MAKKGEKMILRLIVIVLAVGLLSIGGVGEKKADIHSSPTTPESIKIIDGVQHIDIKTPIIIKPAT